MVIATFRSSRSQGENGDRDNIDGRGSGLRSCWPMPRRSRVVAVGVPHHVTQRGNNRQQVFFSDQQRRFYLAALGEQAERNQLKILGYCLMPNHIPAVMVSAPVPSRFLIQNMSAKHAQ